MSATNGGGADLNPTEAESKSKTKGKSEDGQQEEYLDEERLVMDNPEIQARLGEYSERFEISEGFDVPEPPVGTFLCIWPADWLEDPKLVEQAKFAVDEQNSIEKKILTFWIWPNLLLMNIMTVSRVNGWRAIKAMEKIDCGLVHYITLEVRFTDEDKPRTDGLRFCIDA
ncbi:hypothetical protein AKJ16_DCAP24332 [Drosera capensis]